MSKLLFLDTETTGLEEKDRLCQLAYKIGDVVVNELFNPCTEIGVGAMAVHHITNAQVKDAPIFQETEHYVKLKELLENDEVIFIAHNAPFDIKMVEREGLKVSKRIDTLKVARHLLKNDPNVNKYSLQHLRYYFQIEEAAIAHDAFGDIVILEKVFMKLYDLAIKEASSRAVEKGITFTAQQVIDRMIELSMGTFTLIKIMPFGKHEGRPLIELINSEKQYVSWLLNKCEINDGNRDAIESIKYLLKKHDTKR